MRILNGLKAIGKFKLMALNGELTFVSINMSICIVFVLKQMI